LGWAGVDPPGPGAEKGRGFEEGHYLCFFCVDLHAISNAPVLTETTPFGESSEDVDCVVCGDARVQNSELNFMEPSPEMVPHVASNIILE